MIRHYISMTSSIGPGKDKVFIKELLTPANPVSKDKFVRYLKISMYALPTLTILGVLLGGVVMIGTLGNSSNSTLPFLLAMAIPFLTILIGLSIAGGSVLKSIIYNTYKMLSKNEQNNIKLKSNGVFLLILIIALSVSRDFLLILAGFGIYGFVRAANRIAKEELNTRVNWWQMIKTSISSTLKNKKSR
jgi:hypothetical protein